MAALSVQEEGGVFTYCANPIFVTSEIDMRTGAKLTFEVLEVEASRLKSMVGEVATFGLGPERTPFVAEVTSIVPCTSTAHVFTSSHDPVVCCVLTIHGPINLQES
jgi:hypothetical protein